MKRTECGKVFYLNVLEYNNDIKFVIIDKNDWLVILFKNAIKNTMINV
ncbi:hypothetical protein [Pedobacter paludis]|nr:hypothetical protein [Pedobacter paludis]